MIVGLRKVDSKLIMLLIFLKKIFYIPAQAMCDPGPWKLTRLQCVSSITVRAVCAAYPNLEN